MQVAKKGTWVQVHSTVLYPDERTGKLPEDTKKVPLEMWVKGFLQTDTKIGDIATVKTVTDRIVCGELVKINPTYDYGFGDVYIPELLQIGIEVKKIIRGK